MTGLARTGRGTMQGAVPIAAHNGTVAPDAGACDPNVVGPTASRGMHGRAGAKAADHAMELLPRRVRATIACAERKHRSRAHYEQNHQDKQPPGVQAQRTVSLTTCVRLTSGATTVCRCPDGQRISQSPNFESRGKPK